MVQLLFGKMDPKKESDCLFSFGMISDIQYADIDNRLNFSKTCTRYYRNSIVLLREAVRYWSGDPPGMSPNFLVDLGDIIDGFNNEGGKRQSFHILKTVLNEFDKIGCTVHHVLGNHEFYNFTRAEVMNSRLFTGADFETSIGDTKCRCISDAVSSNKISAKTRPAAYYHFSPCVGFRCIVLDTYDMSIIGHDEICPIHQDALHLVRSVNKNDCLNSPVGLFGTDKRFMEFNGGLGGSQMRWLEEVLQKACHNKEKVIIFGHTPFDLSIDPNCLLWNYKEVLNLLHSFDCVVAVITGHTHHFSYSFDEWGIHFVSMPGLVEIQPGNNGFGTIEVYKEKLVLHGVGEVKSLEIVFP